MWAGALCIIGFVCVIAAGVASGSGHASPIVLIVVAVTLLATITAGIVSLFAIALRGAFEKKWRFSLAEMLVATTVVALVLGFFILIIRGS
jgi:hypothetical protein